MKGNPEIIKRLNARLAEELTAINQYVVHAEMCANWGYKRLHEAVEKRAITEMRHAEKLIERILFLEGTPIVSNLLALHIGADVLTQFRNDLNAEWDAVKAYNEDIQFAAEVGDHGSKQLLEQILSDEESHVDWLEAQLDQIEQMGIQVYLSQQVEG
jgi:bacterioferritin